MRVFLFISDSHSQSTWVHTTMNLQMCTILDHPEIRTGDVSAAGMSSHRIRDLHTVVIDRPSSMVPQHSVVLQASMKAADRTMIRDLHTVVIDRPSSMVPQHSVAVQTSMRVADRNMIRDQHGQVDRPVHHPLSPSLLCMMRYLWIR